MTSDEPLPAGALPARGAVVTADDLRLGPGAAGELLGREAPRLPAAAARRVASLCRGAAANLVAVCGATATLGPAVVAQAADQASGVEDLLAHLASGWLAGSGEEEHRALALALEVGYSHPALSAAVLGRSDDPPAGPWLQPLADGWSTLRTGWRDPLRAALAPDRPLGAETVHRAADYLVDRGAAERAVPLYLELEDQACATGAAAGPVTTLAPPLGHGRVGGQLGEPDGHLLTVQLLGQLKVRVGDVAVEGWPSGRGPLAVQVPGHPPQPVAAAGAADGGVLARGGPGRGPQQPERGRPRAAASLPGQRRGPGGGAGGRHLPARPWRAAVAGRRRVRAAGGRGPAAARRPATWPARPPSTRGPSPSTRATSWPTTPTRTGR